LQVGQEVRKGAWFNDVAICVHISEYGAVAAEGHGFGLALALSWSELQLDQITDQVFHLHLPLVERPRSWAWAAGRHLRQAGSSLPGRAPHRASSRRERSQHLRRANRTRRDPCVNLA